MCSETLLEGRARNAVRPSTSRSRSRSRAGREPLRLRLATGTPEAAWREPKPHARAVRRRYPQGVGPAALRKTYFF